MNRGRTHSRIIEARRHNDLRRLGALLGRRKVAKHFHIAITNDALSFLRDHASIAAEAALDGFYVLRTSVPAHLIEAADTVRAYKSLARVERAFRSLKTIDLDIRPVFHWVSPRVRAHVFLCMLAYHLEWHMRQALAPILFDDHDPAAAEDRAPPRSPRLSLHPLPSVRPKPNIPMTVCPCTASKPCSPTSQRSPETLFASQAPTPCSFSLHLRKSSNAPSTCSVSSHRL